MRTSTPSAVTKSVCSMGKSANSTNTTSARLTKLRRPLPICRRTSPVVRPCLVPVRPQIYHRLDRKAHALLCLPNCLVVLVMWDVRRAMEQAVNAVAHVSLDDVALLRLGVLIDRGTKVAEEDAWLDHRDGVVQAGARCLDDTHGVGVVTGFLADIVGLVEIAVVAVVVEGDINVEDIAVNEGSLVGDAVADNFVDRGTYGFREVTVVQWGGV